jgi:DNA-binding MarR family transcriptional regulator
MAKKEKGSPHDSEIFKKVASDLGPRLSTATVFFHETVSGRLGLNATDTKCMAFIFKADEPVTAGDLAKFSGLTTGAVSNIIDRLEKTKLVVRVRDHEDRRKVFVRAHKKAQERLSPLYASLQKSVGELAATYSAAELAIIADFLERSIELLESEAQKLRIN